MKLGALLLIVALQEPPALESGLAEVRALSEAGKPDEAYALCGQLLAPTRFDAWRERKLAEDGVMKRVVAASTPVFDWLGVSGLSPQERAAVHYAEGVVASIAKDHAHAEPVFQSARGLAGPGDVRLASIYNLGVNALLDGEEQRAKIPEIQGGQAAPPTAAAPGTPPPPDLLELARASYLRAKDHFVERLRAQWDDADTRANVELVQRRLKELDEIQKKREQEKQEQEKKDQENQDKDQQDQKKDDEQKNEQEQKDEQPQDDQQKPDPKSDEKSQEEKKDQEQPPPPEEKPQEEKPEQQEPKPAEAEIEKLLTKEEMMRLLDVLKQHEEEYEKLKAQMRQARRAKVKKDW